MRDGHIEIEYGAVPAMKRTYDGRVVYPAGSALPAGASGFTQCRIVGGTYTTWLLESDIRRAVADLERIEAGVKALGGKAAVVAATEAAGGGASCWGSVRDLRVQLINRLYAQAWPLIEAKP